MEIVDKCDMWEGVDGDEKFSHTKIILRNSAEYFYAKTRRRFVDAADVDPDTLTLVCIPSTLIGPSFPVGFKEALPSDLTNSFIKRPSLFYYEDEASITSINALVLQEAEICELLQRNPHPNIAKYLGCVVEMGKIKGLCFVKYGETLLQMTREARIFDKLACVRDIQSGIEHLHGLGLIHCDINPSNIFYDGTGFVIGDFDSCTKQGEKLGLKSGTPNWTNEEFEYANYENDMFGLRKIKEMLFNQQTPGEST